MSSCPSSTVKSQRALHGNNFGITYASALVGLHLELNLCYEVVHNIGKAEENIVLVLILGCKFLQGMLKALQLKAAHSLTYCFSVQGTASFQMLLLLLIWKEKSDETEEVDIEEKEASNLKCGEIKELDLETAQSTARQGTITPRTLNFEDEAGPSSPLHPIQIMESEEQLKVAEVLVAISRPRGLTYPGPIHLQSNPTTISTTDPKDKGKRESWESTQKKKKLTLQQNQSIGDYKYEEVC
ncbi:hypothetical protein Tco_0189250 [Tanacetum coccineum]